AAEEIALEVERLAGLDAGRIEVREYPRTQVERGVVRLSLTVDDPIEEDFAVRILRIGALDESLGGASQRIVGRSKCMPPAVPHPNRVASDVVEHPTLTGLHARLIDPCADHVVVVQHHDPALRVAGLAHRVPHDALIAFAVEYDACWITLLDRRALTLEAVAGDRDEGATQRIEVSNARRGGMTGGLRGGVLFLDSENAVDSLREPGGQVSSLWQQDEEASDVGILLRAQRHRVVGVPCLLPP